jgi:hypothetical protein
MGFRSREAAAEPLGLSTSTIELYETGVRRDNGQAVEIPISIELACLALELIYKGSLETKRISVYMKENDLFSFTSTADQPVSFAPIGQIIAPALTEVVEFEGNEAIRIPGILIPQHIVTAINRAQTGALLLSWRGYNWVSPQNSLPM